MAYEETLLVVLGVNESSGQPVRVLVSDLFRSWMVDVHPVDAHLDGVTSSFLNGDSGLPKITKELRIGSSAREGVIVYAPVVQ